MSPFCRGFGYLDPLIKAGGGGTDRENGDREAHDSNGEMDKFHVVGFLADNLDKNI